MSAADVAQLAVDATFEAFGHCAVYTPPVGSPSDPILIIVDLRDPGARPDDGRPLAGQIGIEVRITEVATPVKGGVFDFDKGSFTVANRPMLADEDGLVWKMWAE
jgi:hypothetical protein